MPRRAFRRPPKQRTTILFKAGSVPASIDDLFRRIFWKSELLAGEAHIFWSEMKKNEPSGMPIAYWKEWIKKRNLSVGQFYNMIHGLVGAGLIEKRENAWHVSSNFLRELEQMLILYTSESGYEHRLR
ncbi:MAG TPA: hypothetical protein VED00_01365 [archaeon]|nr:hypothetical protein [archaeon]